MAEKTPLEELDDAVHRFFERTRTEDNQSVRGWVIGLAHQRLQTEHADYLPLVTGELYAIGPQTSVTEGAGIVRYLTVQTDIALAGGS